MERKKKREHLQPVTASLDGSEGTLDGKTSTRDRESLNVSVNRKLLLFDHEEKWREEK